MFDDDTGTAPPRELVTYENWAMNIALLNGGGLELKNAILLGILRAKRAGADIDDPAVRKEVVARAALEVETGEGMTAEPNPAPVRIH